MARTWRTTPSLMMGFPLGSSEAYALDAALAVRVLEFESKAQTGEAAPPPDPFAAVPDDLMRAFGG